MNRGVVAEAIITKTCKELDIEVIDMSARPEHIGVARVRST